MDIIYPLSNASKTGDDFELRMSLRSLEQQQWVENVFIIGHRPRWVKDVQYIPCGDPYRKSKDANIINKILIACHCCVSPVFVVNSDDQIFLRSVEQKDMFPMQLNPKEIDSYKMGGQGNNWYRRLNDTRHLCLTLGLKDWVFQSHIPYLVCQADYPPAMAKVPWGEGNGYVTHIYYNLTLQKEPEHEPKGRTVRIKQPLSFKMIHQMSRNATFLNFNNAGLNVDMRDFLQKRFPDKSRWEVL